MDRDYTIHEYEGIRFINLTGKVIAAEDNVNFAFERNPDSSRVWLKSQRLYRSGHIPLNAPAVYAENDEIGFNETLTVPHPEDLEWIRTLPEDVLVISTVSMCRIYGYPVCRFAIGKDYKGHERHNLKCIIWEEMH
jgi:hypothetical protein